MDHDPTGALFVFSPSSSEYGQYRLKEFQLDPEPRSVVLITEHEEVLVKSDAALKVLSVIGFPWSGLAMLGQWIPRFLRDMIYDRISINRRLLFERPPSICPMVPSYEAFRYRLKLDK
jgi:predicted DCC family thiol-disulfide oxidoreductase YuxK